MSQKFKLKCFTHFENNRVYLFELSVSAVRDSTHTQGPHRLFEPVLQTENKPSLHSLLFWE